MYYSTHSLPRGKYIVLIQNVMYLIYHQGIIREITKQRKTHRNRHNYFIEHVVVVRERYVN